MAECRYLSDAELAALLASGWTLVSGPAGTQAACEAECASPYDSYNCTSGSCVPAVGGTYPTLEDCVSACGSQCMCSTANTYTVTIAGGTLTSLNGDPQCQCTHWEDTFNMPYSSTIGTVCYWTVGGTWCYGVQGVAVEFDSSTNEWTLRFGAQKDYTCPAASFDCNGDSVFTRVGGDTSVFCSGWPDTLTVSKV